MPCPTCDHTVHLLAETTNLFVRHCPRCGTATVEPKNGSETETYVPLLVERCRDFEAVSCSIVDNMLWHKLGIAESINIPGSRPRVPERSNG